MTLQEAREQRGWTVNQAAKRAAIGHQGLLNLESGKVKPGDIKLKTALAVVRLYWPDISLGEFLGFDAIMPSVANDLTLFDLTPRDNFAVAHLLSGSSSDFRLARS
jgi:transcriptional regulator with XRE-family HTH domain